MNFEDQLRSALAREPAPAEFRRKLMARVDAQASHARIDADAPQAPIPIAWWGRRRISLALAAGLIVGLAIPGAVVERRREERARGIEARNQLITALAVTNTTLRHTRQMIRKTARRTS